MREILKLDENKIRKGRAVGLPYVGSKKKISKKLIQIIIQNFGTDKTIYDLFGGGGAVTMECLINGLSVVYNDLDSTPAQIINKILKEDREYLKTLIVSRDEFFEIKEKMNKTETDNLKLLVNSFGYGKNSYLYSKKYSDIKYKLSKAVIKNHDVFSGYKQTETYKDAIQKMRNAKQLQRLQQLEQLERLQQLEQLQQLQSLQQLERLQDLKAFTKTNKLKVFNKDYKYFTDVKHSIIYLDPPYKNTTKELYKKEQLDYDKFYNWCIYMSKNNIVLISEYDMPSEFKCVYEFKKAKATLQGGQHKTKYEKLFMVK